MAPSRSVFPSFLNRGRLPLSESVVAALQKYLDARKQAGAPTNPDSALFWHRQAGRRYSRVRTWSMLTAVLRRAELKPKNQTCRSPAFTT